MSRCAYVASCALAHTSGDLTSTLVASALTVDDLLTEDYRLDRLNNGYGSIVADKGRITNTAKSA